MKILFQTGFALLCVLSLNANAQNKKTFSFPSNGTYYLPDGHTIKADKIDSVMGAWGSLNIRHEDDKNVFYLFPNNAETDKRAAESKNQLLSIIGSAAKEFDVTDLKGHHYRLSELKGKVIVLNFWFTSCAPCNAEMPELNALKKTYQGRNVVFLALALDNREKLAAFNKTHAFDYILIPDAKQVHQDYKVTSCPTSIVIDPNGIILGIPGITKETLTNDINSALAI